MVRKRLSLIGYQRANLTVVRPAERPEGQKYQGSFWLVRCICGSEKVMRADHVRLKRIQSCGCMRNSLSGKANKKHGHAPGNGSTVTPEYKAWQSAKRRCFNPKDRRYSRYGGRGITMCDKWIDDFGAFFSHIGPRPSSKSESYKRFWSLDRIDPDGDYAPGNVRWTDPSTQANNRSA